MSPILFNILAFIVVLGVLIFVHELGHFLAAKAAGIWVHRFSIGMGKPVQALTTRRGETEYVISWLPIGGYVKMASREEDPVSGALEGGAGSAVVPPDRVFEAKPVWVRMIVILAGVAMNVLFAWLVFSGLFYVVGRAELAITRVVSVAPGLPAGAEGLASLAPGDRILAVAGTPVATWNEIEERFISNPADSFLVEVEGKPPVVIRLHRDALEARVQAIRALTQFLPAVVGEVLPGGPGEQAGVQAGDTLVAVAGRPIRHWGEAVEAIEALPDQEVELTVGRPGGAAGRVVLAARSTSDLVSDSLGVPRRLGKLRLGVEIPERRISLTLGESLAEGGRQTLSVSTQIVRVVRGMFSGRVSTRAVAGPIEIGVMAGRSARGGPAAFLEFMAVISVNLAVLNLLPIPVLDGGQFLFLLGEAVLRRPLSVKLRERLTFVGLVLVVLLMVLAFSNDIRRVLGM